MRNVPSLLIVGWSITIVLLIYLEWKLWYLRDLLKKSPYLARSSNAAFVQKQWAAYRWLQLYAAIALIGTVLMYAYAPDSWFQPLADIVK